MSIRFLSYQIKKGDNLGDPGLWNRIIQELDLRIHQQEIARDALQRAVDEFQELSLSRINDTLVPVLQDAFTRLAEIGLAFNAESTSEVTLGLGAQSLVIPEARRASWMLSDYVSVVNADDYTKAFVGRVVDYDRSTGLLQLDAVLVTGSGTYSAWRLSLAAPPDLSHALREDNPHSVTATQVGAYTTAEADAATAAAIDTALADALDNALVIGPIILR